MSFDLAKNNCGVSFGNSKIFKGLRFNIIDKEVEKIDGINITLGAQKNETSVVNGLSLSLTTIRAGNLNGIQIGGIGIEGKNEIKGISLGLLGAGAGGNITGITIGGFGAGAGGNINGIAIGGLGTGAGGNITGVSIGGLGAGCGNELKGISIAGFETHSRFITGVSLAIGRVKVEKEGNLTGFSASAFNEIRGSQTGVSLGILNYTHELHGFQIGVINYVRDNPKYMKILPLINAHFD